MYDTCIVLYKVAFKTRSIFFPLLSLFLRIDHPLHTYNVGTIIR